MKSPISRYEAGYEVAPRGNPRGVSSFHVSYRAFGDAYYRHGFQGTPLSFSAPECGPQLEGAKWWKTMDTPNNNEHEHPLTSLEQLVPMPDVYVMQKKIFEKPECEQVSNLLRSAQQGSIVVKYQKRDVLPDIDYYAHEKGLVNEYTHISVSLPAVKIRLYTAFGSRQRRISEKDEKMLSEFLAGIGYEEKTVTESEYDRVEARVFMLP